MRMILKGSLTYFFLILIAGTAHALPNGWQEIKTGGDTLCARGAPYSFLVRPGDPQKVVIEFGGGGACWDSLTCANDRVFRDEVSDSFGKVNSQSGIYDHTNTKNPYQSWTHVVIPYCTGDLHLGTADAKYRKLTTGETFEIHHRGAINTKAVLEWLRVNYLAPTDVSVVGCSAGSYASLIWTAYVAEIYKSARVSQFGDSGAGVTKRLLFPQWGMQATAPSWIPSLDPNLVDWNQLNISQIYKGIADFYPQVRFSQFNHDRDRIQAFFYTLMGGSTSGWRPRMIQNMQEAGALANFNYFISSGSNHCAMGGSEFFTARTDGVSFNDWLNGVVNHTPVQNVTCTECSQAAM